MFKNNMNLRSTTVLGFLATFVLCLVVSVGAQAQFEWEISSQSGPNGVVVNDLYYTASTETPIIEMLIDAPGQIYQEGDDVVTVCQPPLATTNADTFVTMGADTFAGLQAGLLVAGGAVDIAGDPDPVCDTNQINMAWAPAAGQNLTPTGVRRLMARLALLDTTDDSVVVVDASTSAPAVEFLIRDGQVVPEPASLGMLGLGLCFFLRRPDNTRSSRSVRRKATRQ